MTMKNDILEYSSRFRILKNGKISLVVCGILAASGAYANPTGGSVASGAATIGGTTTAMTVTQTTRNAIINWNTFNVAGSESVAFTGGNATLNRISDANPSTIAGTVTGDHALFFVNPNGMLVSGTMTAPTLVLSTLGITDTDFNAGHYNFTRGSAAGTISNSGTVGDGGQTGNIGVAALFAANVTNTGTIQSNNIAIVAADAVTLGATTSAVDSSNNYNVTANGSTGVSGITVATVATSISNDSYIGAEGNGVDAGNIDIYSTKGSITNKGSIGSYSHASNAGAVSVESTAGSVINNEGSIYSTSYFGNSGDVSVRAYNDVQSFYGDISSTAYGADKSTGAVSVTATNGMIDNGEGTIRSYSGAGASDTVTLQAKGDINNLYGQIDSGAFGVSANSGAVSLTSDTGSVNNYNSSIGSTSGSGSSGDVTVRVAKNIDNSNYARIYSQANSAVSGAVSLSATAGTIDLSSGGGVYSSGGTAGAVSISAPHLLFTSNEMNNLSYGQSSSNISGNSIALNVDTINALNATNVSFDTFVWSTAPTFSSFSNVSQGMVLGTPATLPTGGTVASGSATIDDTSVANLMTITQASANAIINWSDFSVAYGNTVNFLGGTATLNRVTTSNPSVIAGTVTGDHALFFINPNGIINTGSITAPTLVLSTLAMSDANFNAGTYSFTGGNSGGRIINYGLLGDNGAAANTGVAALFAPKITNTGEISAHNVALVAADTVTLGTTAGYSGVSGMGTTTAATSITNNSASIYATDTGSGAGNIDIYSKNGDIQNHGGTIESYTNSIGGGDITVHALGDIQSYGGEIYTGSYGGGKAGSVSVASANGNIDNSEANIYSQTYASNWAGGSGTAGDAGDVSVVASNGKINNNYGSIYSNSYAYGNGIATSGAAGTVTVNAKSDISNIEGSIYSDTYAYSYSSSDAFSGAAKAVSVTSSNGAVNNLYGQIYNNSYSYGSTNGNTGMGDAGAVSVNGYAGVNNYNSSIYSEGANAGKVTVTASAGSIDNSGWGSIYSYASSGSSGDVSLLAKTGINNSNSGEIFSEGRTQSGNILVSTTGGNLDLANGGQIYSTNYNTGVIGDVTIYAPEVTYTTNEQANRSMRDSYVVSEGTADNYSTYTHGKININANTINGTPIATATLASTADATRNWSADGDAYNFFGTVTTANLKSPIVTSQNIAQNAQDLIGAINSRLGNTNILTPPALNANSTVQTPPAGQAFAQNDILQTQNKDNTPAFAGQTRFAVGPDITGAGNGTAHSTAIPGVFVVAKAE